MIDPVERLNSPREVIDVFGRLLSTNLRSLIIQGEFLPQISKHI
jgi:hypothetical protein